MSTQDLSEKLKDVDLAETSTTSWNAFSGYLNQAKESLTELSSNVSEKGITALLPVDSGDAVQERGRQQKSSEWDEFEDFNAPSTSGSVRAEAVETSGWDAWDEEEEEEPRLSQPSPAKTSASRLSYSGEAEDTLAPVVESGWGDNWEEGDDDDGTAPSQAEAGGWDDWDEGDWGSGKKSE